MADQDGLKDSIRIYWVNRANTALLDHVAEDVFDVPFTRDSLDAFLMAPSHALFVAVNGARVVGQIRGIVHSQPDGPRELYIDNLGVAPDFQRMGLATALGEALLAWGQDKGCAAVWTAAEPKNEEAKSFYASLGLKPRETKIFEANLPAPGSSAG